MCSQFRLLLTSLVYYFYYRVTLESMPKVIALILFILSLASINCKLYQVVALLTPGARYPINDFYDGGQSRQRWGEITAIGLRQHESLGKIFRKDYIEKQALMGTNFSKEQFQLMTMGVNRTIMSGLSNLYGMYPLGNGQKINPAQKSYRIPPYSNNTDIDQQTYALPQGQLIQTVVFSSSLLESCPNQAKQIEKNIRAQLPDYNEMVLTYTPFLKKMGSVFGIDSNQMNFTNLCSLFDTVRADKYLGRSLPSGLSGDDFSNMEHLYNWYNHFTRTYDLAKAYNSYKFNQILTTFDSKIKTPASQLKWTTISVNEVDFVTAHLGLGIASASCIEEIYRKGRTTALNCEGGSPFASSLLFQLHSDDGTAFYVKVRNNGKYINLCGLKQTSCPFSQWKTQVQKGIIADPTSICGKVQEEPEIAIV